eukprot:434254_1
MSSVFWLFYLLVEWTNGISINERSALIDLYNSTSGYNWTKKWDTDVLYNGDYCTLHGIYCPHGYIDNIHLSSNNLNGILPYSLFNLSMSILKFGDNKLHHLSPSFCNAQRLSTFNISINEFFGSIPSCICNMKSLRNVYFWANHFSSEIPQCIGNISTLSELQLMGNDFIGPIQTSLCNAPILYELYLNNNHLSGSIPDCLCNLPVLYRIDLSWNKLTGSINCYIGKNGSYYAVHYNQIYGTLPILSVNNRKNLYTLELHNNQFSGNIASLFDNNITIIKTLKKLKRLTLNNNILHSDNIHDILHELFLVNTL